MKQIIYDGLQDSSVREYAVSLLRAPSTQPASECRALLIQLAKDSVHNLAIRRQAFSSLSVHVNHLAVKQLMEYMARDLKTPAELRNAALLILYEAYPEVAHAIGWKILFGSESPTKMRIFALNLLPEDKLLENIQSLFQLEARTSDADFKKELAARLKSYKRR